MSTPTNISTNGYTWNGVLQFLHIQNQAFAQKENIHYLEKKQLSEKIKQLQGKILALQSINTDLKARNKMLEYALRQIKNNAKIKPENQLNEIPMIPQRRPKPNRAQLAKMLGSLGIRNLLEDIQKQMQQNKQIGQKTKGEMPFLVQTISSQQIIVENSKRYQQGSEVHYTMLDKALQGHQDGIRDLCFDDGLLVSVSQDCTMKFWHLEPYSSASCVGTVREHSGPIFSVIQGDGFIFTGGMEGIIRSWRLPRSKSEKPNIKVTPSLVGLWSNSDEDKLQPVWQLLYHQPNHLMFTTSSQASIKAFHISTSGQNKVTSNYKCSYSLSPSGRQDQIEDIPTAICIHNGCLMAGYVNCHSLVSFDLQTRKPVSQIRFLLTDNKGNQVLDGSQQVSTNKLITHPNYVIGAYQDKRVRIFDRNKVVYNFEAHDDSVMGVCLASNGSSFFSCGHDGYVKIWDSRKLRNQGKNQPIASFKAHARKYDEAVHCVQNYPGRGIAASAGADGKIKLYLTDFEK